MSEKENENVCPDPELSDDEAQALIGDVVSALGAHFDSVRIFVTRKEPGNVTGAFSTGAGNFYAQLGYVREWLDTQDARAAAYTLDLIEAERAADDAEPAEEMPAEIPPL